MVLDFDLERNQKYVLDTRSCGIVLELIELCCGLLAKRGVVQSHRQLDCCFHCSGGESVVHAHCQFDSSLLLDITSAPKFLFGNLMASDMGKPKCAIAYVVSMPINHLCGPFLLCLQRTKVQKGIRLFCFPASVFVNHDGLQCANRKLLPSDCRSDEPLR